MTPTPLVQAITPLLNPDPVDYVVFIGRFQMFHNGHLGVALEAFEHGRKLLLILGSADEPRTAKNPWTVSERMDMIRAALMEAGVPADRVKLGAVVDFHNTGRWQAAVQAEVNRLIIQDGGDPATARVRLIGRHKNGDASTYYLDCFPQWAPQIEVAHTVVMGATDMRNHYYANTLADDTALRAHVPAPVYQQLLAFRAHPAYVAMVREDAKIKATKAKYGEGPTLALDCVIFCGGRVLMIRRKHAPGEGLYAFPGGMLEQNETLLDGALRELNEETGLQMPKEVLRQYMRAHRNYDEVGRDPRGSVISVAFGFHLPPKSLDLAAALGDAVAPVSAMQDINPAGGDDAAEALWLTFPEVLAMRDRLFLDHYTIFNDFLDMPEMNRAA
jgi:bifunctional NMN adenylyltransferase/nudix hydrolase